MSSTVNLARSVASSIAFRDSRVGDLGDAPISAALISERVQAIAAELHRAGVAANEPIVVHVANRTDDLVAFLGIWLAGCVAAPIHVSTPATAVEALIKRVGARFAVRARILERIGAEPPPARPLLEGAALIVFTSGSTGSPKGVVVRHGALDWKLGVLARLIKLTPGDVVAVPLQLTFIFGIWVGLLGLMSGSHVILAPKLTTAAFRGEAAGVTTLAAVPTLLRTLMADALQTPNLKRILTGGEPFTPALANDLATRLPHTDVYDLFGLTETGSCDFCVEPRNRQAARGTIGRSTEGVQYRIAAVPELGLPSGVGELQIRTPAIMAGYLDDPALTASTFADGFFKTGDLATERSDGFVALVGRSKDVVSRGGNKIAPMEIENLFAHHAGVAGLLAFGMPDERLGESLHLMVVARDQSLTEQDLRAWAAGKIERFKMPDFFHFVASLPTGRTGKVDRAAARQALAAMRG